jgi:hypothetical protein
MQFDANVNQFAERTKAVYFHTSHPGLCAALRRDKRWVQVSQMTGGGNRKKSVESINASRAKTGLSTGRGAGYGGHLRAVSGFRMSRPMAESCVS